MKKWFLLPAAAILLLAAVPAIAAIDNTHHDVTAYTEQGTTFTCYACHGYKETLGQDAELGAVGSLCWRCHVGTSSGLLGATLPLATDFPNVGDNEAQVLNTANRGPVYPDGTATVKEKYTTGHKRDWATNWPATDNAASKPAITNTWPHVNASATDIECTGCHDVHSNTYAPFLRAPQSLATGAGSIGATFCIQCHTGSDATNGNGRWVAVTAYANGGHPIEVDPAGAATRATAKSATANRDGRRIVIKGSTGDNASVFKVSSPYAAGTTSGQLGNPNTHYRPGGKVGAFNNPTDNGVVGCYTCHSVHMPDKSGTNNLTVVSLGDPVDTTESFNDLCVACHGTAGAKDNPGVEAYYHPVSGAIDNGTEVSGVGRWYAVSTGTFNVLVDTVNGSLDLGLNNRLVCTTCHAPAHGGAAGTMILNPVRPSCDSCHDVSVRQGGTAPNSHHVYGGNTNYTAAANGGYANPSYTTTWVDLANGLSCEDCHAYETAHNWTN